MKLKKVTDEKAQEVCVCLLFLSGVVVLSWFNIWVIPVVGGFLAVVTSPLWGSILWNKFIANSEEYYDSSDG